MAGTVEVKITGISNKVDPPGSEIEYEVRNDTERPIWVVDDGWLTWRQDGQELELSYARGKMRQGAQVFGYFVPVVVKLDPGSSIMRTAHLKWPQSLDRLWNLEPQAAPAPGDYRISVRIGYGVTAEPDSPRLGEDVETPVLRWQREAVSTPVTINVPPY
jgi:hypothetical protein